MARNGHVVRTAVWVLTGFLVALALTGCGTSASDQRPESGSPGLAPAEVQVAPQAETAPVQDVAPVQPAAPAQEIAPVQEVAPATAYVGSKNSNKYHYPSCGSAGQIHKENLLTFDGEADAQASGYVPCKNCNP
jgi:hypothetical protein